MIISNEVYDMYELNLNYKLSEVEYRKSSNVNAEVGHHDCDH